MDLFGDIPPLKHRDFFPCETTHHLGLVLVHDAKNTRRNPSQGISKWILKGLAAFWLIMFGRWFLVIFRDPYVDLLGGAMCPS